jgi:hypothetical protein
MEGTMMKSRFFPKRDEVVLSTVTALIVCGLVYQGLTSLVNGKEHAIFQKNSVVISKK